MQAHLSLQDGRRVPVRSGMTIGRVAGNDLVIKDTKASRRHARIHFEGGVAEVEDLGSSNGTLLNGKSIEKRVMRSGDVVRIGTTEITYLESALDEGAAAPAEPVPIIPRNEREARPQSRAEPIPEPAPPPVPQPAPTPADDDDVDLFGDASDDDDSDQRASPAAETPVPATEPTASASIEPDEDDLFDGPPDEHLPPPPPGVTRVPLPPIGEHVEPVTAREPVEKSRQAVPKANVVEFADEVVEVRKAAPAKQAARSAAMPAAGEPQIEKRERVLQFSKTHKPGGVLADDLSQMSGLKRLLIVLVVLGVGVGIIWGLMIALR